MKNITASMLHQYIRVVYWFVPGQFQQNPLTLSRCQNLVGAAAIAGISDPFYALCYHLFGFSEATSVILMCGAFMAAAPFVLKITGKLRLAEEVFVCAVYFNFCWLTWHLGGVDAPTAPWLIICPVVAMLLGGVASGLFWLAMSSLAILAIYLLEAGGAPMPVNPIEETLLLGTVCSIGLFIVLVAFVLFFELTKTQGFVKLERAMNLIQELAIRDELTGVHNRRHLIRLLEEELERSRRLQYAFCICLLDIDNFKRINDTYGHAVGDIVLKTFAATAQSVIRSIDSFGRYGGEEFLLILPQTDLDQALILAERVRAGVERISFSDVSDGLAVTVSIGIAEYRNDEDIAMAVARADKAVYRAKSEGRNRVVLYRLDDPIDPESPVRRDSIQRADATRNAPAALLASGMTRTDSYSPHCSQPTAPAILQPVDEQRRHVYCYEHGIQYDPLTGLPNRHLFRDRLNHAMQRAVRNQQVLALLAVDINKFKELNDALGCENGDLALVEIAQRVKKCLRDCDTVSRWDGDELIIILEDVVNEKGARIVAQKLIKEVAKPIQFGVTECVLSSSVGIVLYPDNESDLDRLLKKIDVALRQAKASGQNNYRFHSREMNGATIDPLILKNELRHALFRDELQLQYQPQVDIGTNRIVGVEALIRWQHPALGFISPAQFIPLAEETGLIIPIGDWVLRTACEQSKAWRDAGLAPVKTAVNLSACQLKQSGVVERIDAIIQETGMDPGDLELEVTEGVLIENLQFSKEVISELRAIGIKISIDDFGTGYSSLSYLSELPLDLLKMDGSFVRRLDQPANTGSPYSIAEAIILMAHNLNLKVIAEAVETEQQLEILHRMKCDQMQGYLFSRPVAASVVADMLAKQSACRWKSFISGHGRVAIA